MGPIFGVILPSFPIEEERRGERIERERKRETDPCRTAGPKGSALVLEVNAGQRETAVLLSRPWAWLPRAQEQSRAARHCPNDTWGFNTTVARSTATVTLGEVGLGGDWD